MSSFILNILNQLGITDINQENFHAMIVHFPVALTVTFILFYFLSFIKKLRGLRDYNLLLGAMAYLTMLFAKQSGELAGETVALTLKNPQDLTQHAAMATNAIYIFTGLWVVILLEKFLSFKFSKAKGHKAIDLVLKIVICLFLLTEGHYLIQAGHKGAILVYKHAGGVSIPEHRLAK